MKNFLILAFVLLFGSTFAQNNTNKGTLTGKITDLINSEELIGSIIMIENTTFGDVSDVQGNFIIKNIPTGTYNILCKSLGYQPKRIEGVIILSGEITLVNITMEETKKEVIKEVVITATIDKEKNVSLLIAQKNSTTISDGVSSESIKKTPDKTTSDVLKRVSGTSIQDNKFVIIRGLNDRYNAAFINGAPLPSSESDRKAFSFDIFPANLLDNLVVIKTATPDLPADFAGGIINITTKSIPDKNYNSFSLTTGYNSITTFKEGYTYQGGKMDWLGLDDGKRSLPSKLPSSQEMRKSSIIDGGKYASYLSNDWGLKSFNALPNLSFQYTNAHTFKIKKMDFGSIGSVTYNNTNSFNSSIRREFDEGNSIGNKAQQQYELSDKNYSKQILVGILANFSLQINDNNTIGFKNLFNINSEDKVIIRNGIREFESNPQLLEKSNARWFTENKLYTGQIIGDHFIVKQKIKIHWIGSISNINRNVPNLRRMMYTMPSISNDPDYNPIFTASIPISGSTPTTGGNIFYSNNKENIYSFNSDVTIPINFKSKSIKTDLKFGGGYQYRNRNFNVRELGLTKYTIVGGPTQFDNNLLLLPEDKIFSPSNMGILSNGKGGFKLEEQTKLNDSYKANSSLVNGFVMFDTRVKEKLRLIYGVRMERFSMILHTAEDDGSLIDTSFKKVDFLPSINMIYSLTKFQNIRLSYSNTVSRPEYREIAPFGFYDFVNNYTVRGNPSLKRGFIYNFDVRYEIFPGKGQIFSVSLFYKSFKDAIEQITVPNTTPEINFSNVSHAKNYGMETEVRLLLSSIFKRKTNILLNSLTFYTNLALIKSDISVADIQGIIVEKRPLQGQSPFIVNSGLQYYSDKKHFSASLSYNIIGRRIAIVGNALEPNIWENGRSIIDFQLVKTFLKNNNLEIKLNIKDGFAQKQFFYQDINKNKNLDLKTDNIISEVTNGRVVSFGVSYKF